MRRKGWLPHPLLSLLLALAWLALQQSLAAPNLISAAVLGWGLPRLVDGFLGPALGIRTWGVVLRLLFIVFWDIVLSNIAVARIVLTPGSNPQPAWVPVMLDIEHPMAITLLATIITTTPGTVSCVVDETRKLVLVHALDCADPAQMAEQIKQRYEVPLREIFG